MELRREGALATRQIAALDSTFFLPVQVGTRTNQMEDDSVENQGIRFPGSTSLSERSEALGYPKGFSRHLSSMLVKVVMG